MIYNIKQFGPQTYIKHNTNKFNNFNLKLLKFQKYLFLSSLLLNFLKNN